MWNLANILINSLKNDIIAKQEHFAIPLESPKDIKMAVPYAGMTVKEIREQMKKNLKDDEN